MLDALERGEGQVLGDEIARRVLRGLSAELQAYYQTTATVGPPTRQVSR